MKILIIRLSAIGDTIHCLPSAAELKHTFPTACIAWMVEPPSAPLVVNNPVVDKVFVLPKGQWLQGLKSPALFGRTVTDIGAFWSEVRAEKFDVVIDYQGLMKSAICSILSGASRRIGFAGTREGAHLLLTSKLDIGDYFAPDRHIVDLNLALTRFVIEQISGLSLTEETSSVCFPLPPVPPEAVARVNRMLEIGKDSGKHTDKSMVRNVVLLPGTTWDTKIWDWSKWCQLSKLMAEQLDFRICLAGGASDLPVNNKIASWLQQNVPAAQVVNLTGQTSLLELITLFQRSALVVGADTGPLHLAAAVGMSPVVAVFGSTPYRRNGPYGKWCHCVSLALSCQPCFQKKCPLGTIACLKELPVEQVFGAVQAAVNM